MTGKELLRGGYTQFTPSGKALFVKANQYFSRPEVGDIVYFFSKTKGRVAHVGIVKAVEYQPGGIVTFKTIEGNTSVGTQFNRNGGVVAEKTYTITTTEIGNGNLVDGFGRPAYGPDTATVKVMLRVAQEEIGYEEKESMAFLQDKHKNAGYKNFTKYGLWYGSTPAYWCQQFVSWVAAKACAEHLEQSRWVKDNNGWRFIDADDQYVKDAWQFVDGRWYAFNGAGYAISGWFISNGAWYYLNPEDYAMLSGQWIAIDGKSYYLDESGVMVTNSYVKNGDMYHFINARGEWDKTKDTTTPDLEIWELVG